MKAAFYIIFCSLFITPLKSSAQWTKVSNPDSNANIFINAMDAVENCALLGSQFKTTDNGKNWTKMNLPTIGDAAIDVSVVDSLHYWAATESGKIISTSDGGENWAVQFENKELTSFMNYIKMFDLNNGVAMGDAPDPLGTPSDSNKALFLRTTDGGKNWQTMENNSLVFASGDLWRRVDFISPQIGYFYENFNKSKIKGILKTTDGGNNWTVIYPASGVQLLKFYDDNLGFLISYNSQFKPSLMKTIDGGVSWNIISLSLTGYGNDIEFIKNNPAKIWITDYDNLFFSDDTGKTWSKQTLTNGILKGRDIVFSDENHGWLLTESGVYYTNNGGVISSIKYEGINIANEFKLFQNYPNPFNPTTQIKFGLPEASRVVLNIYNILGEVVETLINKEMPAGVHNVSFNASELASGLYIYMLQADDFISTKKMMLIK